MSTPGGEEHALAPDLLEALGPEGIEAPSPRRRGRLRRWLTWLVVLGILAGAAAAAFPMLGGAFAARSQSAMLTHPVQEGDLLVSITEDGNLESASNLDIKAEVAGGSTILWIVEDGKEVQKGEKLAELDSSQLEDQINQQKITFEKAQAAYVQAEKDYNVAVISVKEYEEGTYVQQLQDLEAQITIAMENLRSAQNSLQHTQQMFRKGYVSPLQREAQEFAVKRAELELASAQTAKEVLEQFTKAKTLEDLRSQVATAQARMNSEKASFELEEARLKRLQAQLEKCLIVAPQAGMVVYANETGRHRMMSQQPQIEEGAMVREQQTMFRLPDLAQMQVKVAVHESKVDQLSRGMRARIRIQDQEFQGQVYAVANQPESSGWFSANVKEYATTVRIDGQHAGLKPGMTAEVEILVAHLKDVLTLPVATVVEQRSQFFCWVEKGEKVERRPLVLGPSNEKFVQIKDGVAVGDEVIMNPRAVVAEARQDREEEETVDVEKKFGTSSAEEAAGPGADRGTPRPGGPAAPGGPARQGGPPPAPKSPADAFPGPGGPGAPRGGPGGGPGGGRSPNLMDLDQDGDGKVSREEAPEQMRPFFDRMDGNGDGFIDSAEEKEMRQRFGQGGGRRDGGGPPGGGGPPDAAGRPGGGGPPGGAAPFGGGSRPRGAGPPGSPPPGRGPR